MESEYEGFPNKAWSGKTGVNCIYIPRYETGVRIRTNFEAVKYISMR